LLTSARFCIIYPTSDKKITSCRVNDTFLPLFTQYIEETLNRDIDIFLDTTSVAGGSAWQNKIKNALVYSKCMIAVWTPAYFRSQWCVKEFSVFHKRQTTLKYLTLEKPEGLIIPIQLFDGTHYKKYLDHIQALDCRNYNRVGTGIKKTALYIELQDILMKWAKDVAAVIENIPPNRMRIFYREKIGGLLQKNKSGKLISYCFL
jgi:predicted transcriptional regulator